jgi:hypothetical protein
VKEITEGSDGLGEEDLPIINRLSFDTNHLIDEQVWDIFDRLPSQTVPRRDTKPVKRLVQLAQALSEDSISPGLTAIVTDEIHEILDGMPNLFAGEFLRMRKDVVEIDIQVIKGRMHSNERIGYRIETLKADERSIRWSVEDAKRVFGGDVIKEYLNKLAPDVDDLGQAFVTVAALAKMPGVQVEIDSYAEKRSSELFERFAKKINNLSDERRQDYEDIRALATTPQQTTMRRPLNRIAGDDWLNAEGHLERAPRAPKHLFAGEDGLFPVGELNSWERAVVNCETSRSSCLGWYRNPSNRGTDVFAIPYRDRFGAWRSLHPDVIVFEKLNGLLLPSIVDPHATNLEDGRFKLNGLSKFAEEFGDAFHRILSISSVSNKLRSLDLKRSDVREKVFGYEGNLDDLYKSGLADDYC